MDKLKSGQIYGLKLSYNIIGSQILDSLGLDATAGYIETTSTADNSKAKVYHFRLDATYPIIFKNSNFTPFLAVGAGANLYERNAGSETKPLVAYGCGLKYKLLDYLFARTDVRHILIVTPERPDNVEFTAGLTYTFGVERKPKPEESDKNKKAKEKLEKEKLEKEKLEKEKLEKEKLEKEKLEKEKLEKEKFEKEELEKERLEKERLEKQKLEKQKLAKELIEYDTKAKERNNGKTTAEAEKIGDSSSVAKSAAGNATALQPAEGGAAVTATAAAGKGADAGKAPVTGKKPDGRRIAKPVEAVPPAAAVAPQSAIVAKAEAYPSAKAPSAPASTAPAVTTLEALSVSVALQEISPESKTVSPMAPAKATVTVTAPAGEAVRETTTPATVVPSAPVAPAAPAVATIEAAPAPDVTQEVSPKSKIVPPAAPAEPTVAVAPPAGEAAKKATPPAVAPSAPAVAPVAPSVSVAVREVSPESKTVSPPSPPAKPTVTATAPAGEAARETTTPAAVAPSAPVIAPVEAAPTTVEKGAAKVAAEPVVSLPVLMAQPEKKPGSAATREVSPERTTVPPAATAKQKIAGIAPSAENARKITAPVAAATSKPTPKATAPVAAAPAPVEKDVVKAAAEPAAPSPAYNALPEETRQMAEQPGKVSPATPAAVPAKGAAVLTSIAGTVNGVDIQTSAPVAHLRYFELTNPARLVIDVPGADNGTGKKTFSLGCFGLAGARVSIYHGKLRIVLDAEGKTFPRFRIKKSATGLRVALVESAPPAQEVAPAPAETKQEYLLQFTIEYDTAKAVIRPQYDAMMRKAAEFLLSSPDNVAEISGHTDSIGKARYNVLLSQRRADSVKKFFVKKYGVDGSRIIVRGFGYYFPIADNATEAGRQKNRRTEVTIAIRKGGATPKPGTGEGTAPAPSGGEPH